MSFRLVTTPAIDDRLAPGTSKLGGAPDLPPGTPWPARAGAPLAFVLQLDLSGIDTGGELPADGLLSFFYDAVEEPWGDEPEDAGSWLVTHVPAGTPLERRAFPDDLPEDVRYDAVTLAAEPVDDADEGHLLLGAPEPLQGELDPSMRLLLQVASDDGTGMMWCDDGVLYVLMPPDALACREWDRAWVVLQSH